MACKIIYKGISYDESDFKSQIERYVAINNLFNENKSLANAVYEALGFDKKNNTVRLYRIENKNIPYDESREGIVSKKEIVGGFFTDNIDTVTNYIRKNQSQEGINLVYVDISKNDLDKYHVSKNEYAKTMDVESDNWIIPSDINRSYVDLSSLSKVTGNFMTLSKAKQELKSIIDNLPTSQITPEQKQQALQLYSQYLDTIFPDSKVKDIVYHGSKNKLQGNKFDLSKARFEKAIFFFKNKINALKWESENPIKIQKEDLKNIIELNKDLNLEDNSLENNIFYTLAGASNINELSQLPNSKLILKDFDKIGGVELYLEKSLQEIKEILSKYTGGKNNNVINALINITNPKKENNLDYIKLSKEGEKIKDIFKEASKNTDGVILENITEYTSSKKLAEPNFKTKTVTFNANFGIQTDELYSLNTDTQYAVFEPEQIHILGSKQDIEGFKKFINVKSKNITPLKQTIVSKEFLLSLQDKVEQIKKYC